MAKLKTLTWNDRLALIDHYKPNDIMICDTFDVSQDELDTARTMLTNGTFSLTRDIDYGSYSSIFSIGDKATTTIKPHNTSTSGITTTIKPGADKELPQSATKKVKLPQKRGRKGSKILEAFTAIPSKPTNAEAFAQSNDVSIAVLRQSKRFDKTGMGLVKVKKDKESGNLMIWRESDTGETQSS